VYLEIGKTVIQKLADEPGYAAPVRAQHYEPYVEWRPCRGPRVASAKLEMAQKNGDAARVLSRVTG
jgi:hypothetical protein